MKIKLFTILLTLTLSACNKDDDSGSALPEATQIGANTVGCLVNGEVFLPHAEGINPPVNCFYQFVGGEYFFTMAFSDLRGFTNETVSIQTGRIDLQEDTYTLDKNPEDDGDYTGGGGTYLLTLSNIYYTNIITSGELTISRIDVTNSIVSGTFWFDAINDNGEVVQIREGRFDWRY